LGFGKPAAAATVTDVDVAFLTFVTFGGASVSCKLTGVATYDTDEHLGQVTSYATRSDGLVVPECEADHRIDAVYRDRKGDDIALRGEAFGSSQLTLWLYDAQRNVRATHTIVFSQCDPGRSTTCTLTVRTAAK
jgi:hypothetical protein